MKHTEDARDFRERVRRDLRSALKLRQPERVSALRAILAAIDNAEAVDVATSYPSGTGGVIAHSCPGVGSTEAPRRRLTMADVVQIVSDLVRDDETHAQRYGSMRRTEAADALRRKAAIMRSYL